MPKILVADDQLIFLKVIDSILTKQGYEVVTAGSGQEALDILKNDRFDLLLSDIMMEPVSGMDLLERIRDTQENLCVIMLTSCEKIEVAIEAMKLGAFDYLTKPIQVTELTHAVQRALEYIHSINSRKAKVKLEYNKEREKPGGVIAESSQMIRVCELIERIALTDGSVMFCGEPGSGTELAARNLHRCSARSDHPFIKIDCTAIPPEALEDKLFGNGGKSSQSLFDASIGGTLFIHEVGEMPIPVQDRLLRELKQRDMMKKENDYQMNVRVVSDSSEEMDKLVQSGRFSEALYQRIRSFFIHIPPLRERQEDINPLIARMILQHLGPQAELPMLNREAEELLKSYRWPGNVNELMTTIQYALNHLENNTITKASLPPELVEEAVMTCEVLKGLKPAESLKGRSLKAFLHDEERGPVKQVLKKQAAAEKQPGRKKNAASKKNGTATAPDDSASFEWL